MAQRKKGDAGRRVAHGMDHELAARLERLQAWLRLRRLQREAAVADDMVVVKPSHSAAVGSPELHALSAIQRGHPERLLHAASGGREPAARMDIVRRLGPAVVLRANMAALRLMRQASPGLRIHSASYAYPQYIRPLGDELLAAELQVEPGARARRFSVQLRSPDGAPIAGVKVRALLAWDGTHIAADSDARGVAEIGVPTGHAEVVLLLAEPEHTYWSGYRGGFARSDAPRRVDMVLAPLAPDGYRLLGHYAPYQEDAGAGVTVGVIDGGVGPHDDLSLAGGACLVSDENEADYLDNGIGHGTHVAGIIAARRSADGAVYGLAPRCRLLSYRVCPRTGPRERAASTDIAAALERAIAERCDLVNISLGSVEAMPEIPDLLQKARDAGVVVFAATGNDGRDLLRYPARYSHTLAVAALGRDGTFPPDCPETFQESEVRRGSEFVAAFSNYGLEADLIGPGVAVLSTFPQNRYAMMSGTSMAAPFATGMAARLLAQRPEILRMPRTSGRADAVFRMLTQSTRRPGWSAVYGAFGVLK